MRRIALVSACFAALAAGCTTPSTTGSITPPGGDQTPPPAGDQTPPGGDPPPPPGPVTTNRTVKAHFLGIAGLFASDRTQTAVDVNVRTLQQDGQFVDADVVPQANMANGTVIPTRTGMTATAGTAGTASPTFQSAGGDAFLDLTTVSPDLVIGRYRVQTGTGTSVVGFAVDGNGTANMPTSSTATFNGTAALHMVGGPSLTSKSATGTTAIEANFVPGGGTVSGRIAGITQEDGGAAGFDLVLNPVPITGNSFSGSNKVSAVVPGGTDPAGALFVISSDYQGGFFGTGAERAAGTFQVQGAGGGALPLDIVGAFHGARP